MMASLESKSALANVVVGTIVALVVIQQLHLTCLAANTIGQSAESDETTEAVVAVAVAAAEDNQSGDIDDGDMKLVDSDGALDDPTIDDNEDGNNINNRSTQRAFNLRDFFGSSSILKSSGKYNRAQRPLIGSTRFDRKDLIVSSADPRYRRHFITRGGGGER